MKTRRRWYFYLTDKGIFTAFRQLLGLPYLGPVIREAIKVGLIFGILWVLYLVRQPFAPSDWVEVSLRNVPKGLRQIYMIADGPNGVRAMNFYWSMVMVYESDPRLAGQNWFGITPDNQRITPDDQRFGTVKWPEARRYGAIAQRADGKWEVWWFGKGDLEGPSLSRYVVGEGHAKIQLPDEALAVTPSKELLDHLGLPDAPAQP